MRHGLGLSALAACVALVTLVPAALQGCGSGELTATTAGTAPPTPTTPSVATPVTEAPTTESPSAPGATAGECADDGVAARAVRVTLAHAQRQGIAHAHLADCRFEVARCGAERTERTEETDGARCVVDVQPMSGTFQIRVHPRALAGAPRWIDASLDASAPDPPERFYVGASTWAVGRSHSLVVGGVDGHISHTHGGEPAHIGHAELSIRNGAPNPLRVTTRSVEWLTSSSCEVPSAVRARPPVTGLTIAGGDSEAPQVTVAAGATSAVTVWFAPQPAYYSYCDRFAARVTLDAGGETIAAVVEWEVIRREPLQQDAP